MFFTFRHNSWSLAPLQLSISSRSPNTALSIPTSEKNHTHDETVKGTTHSGTNTLVLICTPDPHRTNCTRDRHLSLSADLNFSSRHESVFGASIKMSPSLLFSYTSLTAPYNILSSSSLKIGLIKNRHGDNVYCVS